MDELKRFKDLFEGTTTKQKYSKEQRRAFAQSREKVMTEIFTRFRTNIDAYRTKQFPEWLPARPMMGDKVPFDGQLRGPAISSLPVLTITSITCNTEGGHVRGYECYLDMVDVPDELRRKVLNHEIQF